MSSPSEGCLQLPHGQVLVQVWADVASCPSPAAAAAAELYICRGQASSCEGGLAGACRAEDGIGEAAGRGHGRVPGGPGGGGWLERAVLNYIIRQYSYFFMNMITATPYLLGM